MNKLPIHIGILAWKSGQTLIDTLTTYHENGLLMLAEEVTILFQEVSDTDKMIAEHFNINYIGLENNIGIGQGFVKLAEHSNQPYFLALEHDWKLYESVFVAYNRFLSGLILMEQDVKCVRYRHRRQPGFPHFSFRYQGKELEYYDEQIGCTSPHLLDSLHWTENPDVTFSPMITKRGEYYVTTSRYGNWTNNPCLYKKEFYINTVSPFVGDGIDLEGKISKWWAQQNYEVAHGEGLFTHIDNIKYPMR